MEDVQRTLDIINGVRTEVSEIIKDIIKDKDEWDNLLDIEERLDQQCEKMFTLAKTIPEDWSEVKRAVSNIAKNLNIVRIGLGKEETLSDDIKLLEFRLVTIDILEEMILRKSSGHTHFTKSDLKDGMVVELASGSRGIVVNGIIMTFGKAFFIDGGLSEDMTMTTTLYKESVVKVFLGTPTLGGVRDESLYLLWEREFPWDGSKVYLADPTELKMFKDFYFNKENKSHQRWRDRGLLFSSEEEAVEKAESVINQ